jgi:hypothetical protein
MDESCKCCVLSVRGLCDRPILHPEESYREKEREREWLSVIRCNSNLLHLEWVGRRGQTIQTYFLATYSNPSCRPLHLLRPLSEMFPHCTSLCVSCFSTRSFGPPCCSYHILLPVVRINHYDRPRFLSCKITLYPCSFTKYIFNWHILNYYGVFIRNA